MSKTLFIFFSVVSLFASYSQACRVETTLLAIEIASPELGSGSGSHREFTGKELLELEPKILGYVVKLAPKLLLEDARDIVQETFLLMMINRSKFRGDASPFTWSCTIARNLVFSKLRKEKGLRNDTTELDFDAFPTFHAAPEAGLENTELHELLQEAIAALSEDHRAVVQCVLEGKTYEQGATQLGIELNTFRSRYSRAREALATYMLQRLNPPEE